MDELTEKIRTRIAELKTQREQLATDLQRRAQALLDPFNFAIAELEKLVDGEGQVSDLPVQSGEEEKAGDLPASWDGK